MRERDDGFPNSRRIVFQQDPGEPSVLFGGAESRQPPGHVAGGGFQDVTGAEFRGGLEKIATHMQEPGEAFECVVCRVETGRNGWLLRASIHQAVLDGGQPAEVEGAWVAACQRRPDRK